MEQLFQRRKSWPAQLTRSEPVAVPAISKYIVLVTKEEILLFANLEWQMVVNIHNSNHGVNCMKEALQCKFN
jgi:hypothetical protein